MRACIFDLDGTLLDSMGIWSRIDEAFLKQRGFAVPPDYVRAIAHLRFPEVADYTIRRFGLSETPDEVMARWLEMATFEYGHSIALKPGAKEYLTALRERGVRLAVATSMAEPLREVALARHGIAGWFEVVCGAEEVARGKEFPDLYLHTAEQMGIAPALCCVFEDILPGVRSAKQAGMTVYGVHDETTEPDEWEAIVKIADGTLADFWNAPLPEYRETEREKEKAICHFQGV